MSVHLPCHRDHTPLPGLSLRFLVPALSLIAATPDTSAEFPTAWPTGVSGSGTVSRAAPIWSSLMSC